MEWSRGTPPEWSHYVSGLPAKKKQIARRNQFRGKWLSIFLSRKTPDCTASCSEEIDILGEDCLITAPKRHSSLLLYVAADAPPLSLVLFLLLLIQNVDVKTRII